MSWERFMPSWRSSASSRSSCMKSDCIMSWSWRRWPGDMLESSDCIWPLCWAICSMSWSRFSAPGKWSPHFCLNASKSGSRPSARSWSMRLRSRSISRMRSRSWGLMLPSAFCMFERNGWSICCCSPFISSQNSRCASGSMNS